jgi:hypothetical protein
MGLVHQFNRIDGLEHNSMLRLTDEAIAQAAVVTADACPQLSWRNFAVFGKLRAGSRSARPLAVAGLRRTAAEKDHQG